MLKTSNWNCYLIWRSNYDIVKQMWPHQTRKILQKITYDFLWLTNRIGVSHVMLLQQDTGGQKQKHKQEDRVQLQVEDGEVKIMG